MAEQKQLLLDFIAQYRQDRPAYEILCRRAAQMVDALDRKSVV